MTSAPTPDAHAKLARPAALTLAQALPFWLKLGFTAPLSAITAAVVGVILNLALFFAYHVLWPQGFGGHFEATSAIIVVAAVVALFRFKVGVLPLLGTCAAAGLAVTLLAPGLR